VAVATDQGVPRMLETFQNEPEALRHLVDSEYLAKYGALPDAGGRACWVQWGRDHGRADMLERLRAEMAKRS